MLNTNVAIWATALTWQLQMQEQCHVASQYGVQELSKCNAALQHDVQGHQRPVHSQCKCKCEPHGLLLLMMVLHQCLCTSMLILGHSAQVQSTTTTMHTTSECQQTQQGYNFTEAPQYMQSCALEERPSAVCHVLGYLSSLGL